MTTIDPLATRAPVLPTAAAAQVVLLAGLALSVGLGPAGWLAGTAWTVFGWLCLHDHADRLGPADQVTLARATLTG
ncbi:MAG: hypothetical protein ACRDQB_15165, partial [Thermocrispum sp.]